MLHSVGEMPDEMVVETAFRSSTITLRSPEKRIYVPIPTAPKKTIVKPTIKENEENEGSDEPSTPTRPSPIQLTKSIESTSMNDTSETPCNPSKMLIQTAINMLK